MSKREKGWKKGTRRLTALMVSLLMLVTMIPLGALPAYAETNDSKEDVVDTSDTNEVFEIQTKEPKELDKYPDDVYGSDADPVKEGEENDNTPFLLSEQNELQLYYCGGVRTGTGTFMSEITTYPFQGMRFTKLSDEKTSGAIPGVNRYGDPSATPLDESKLTQYRDMSFAQGVGFDAKGTGRKEYTAIVGLKLVDEKYKITLIVQNAKDLGEVKEYDLGEAKWMYDINKATDTEYITNIHLMDNYFSITAGDYDNDGRESVMAYACVDGSDPKIVEVGTDENGNWLDGAKEIVKIKDVVTKTDWITYPNEWRFKPAVSLATGDFDGDNYDELAYSAGFYNNSYDVKDGYKNISYIGMKLEDFATTVGTFDYEEKSKAFTKSSSLWLYDRSKRSASGKTVVYDLYMLHGGAITAGDVDGDGLDEIVAAGYTSVHTDETGHATATYENAVLTKIDGLCNWEHDKIATAVIDYASKKYKASALGITGLNNCFTYNMELMGESLWIFPQLSMACAKTNGASAPEDVFISGTVFDFSKTKPAAKYTADYFSNQECYGLVFDSEKTTAGIGMPARHYTSLCTWVRGATAGNFTQNSVGREQFVFTAWGISVVGGGSVDKYPCGAVVGMIAGTGYNDETEEYSDEVVDYGSAGEYVSSPVKSALSAYSTYGIESDTYPCSTVFGGVTPTSTLQGGWRPGTSGFDNVVYETGSVNALPIAVDIDNDGLLARFNNRGFIYTDPNVICVLQAAPYFAELDEAGGYNGYGDTSYGITTGYETSSTKGDTVGFEVGYTAEGSVPGIKVALEAGYAMEWSHEYQEAYSVEETKTFHAEDQSLVVLTRIPQLVYTYDVYEKGKWITNGVSVRVPLSARYFMLTIDEYNEFVDEYNRYAELGGEEDRLIKITDEDIPEGHEGIPEKYWDEDSKAGDTGRELSSPVEIGHGGGSSSYNRNEGSSSTESETTSHGFHFGLTIQAGADYPGGEAWAGGYANLDYSHSTGYSTTQMSSVDQGGQVPNINTAKLEKAGFQKGEADKYTFTWTFGDWKRQLQSTGKEVPFLGYFVTGVGRPEGPAAISGQSTIKITEGYDEEFRSGAYSVVGTPEPTIAINDIDERIEYDPETRQLVIKPGLPVGNYKVTMRATNKYGTSKFGVLIQVIKSSDHRAADRVAEMINALNIDKGVNMSYEEIKDVDEAESAYNNLTDSQKQYISQVTVERLQIASELVYYIYNYSGADYDDNTYRKIVKRFEEIEAQLKGYSEGKNLGEFSSVKGELMYELEKEINILFRTNDAVFIELMKTDFGKNFWYTVSNIFTYYGQAYIKEQNWTDSDIDYHRYEDFDTSECYNRFYDLIDELDGMVEGLGNIDPNSNDYTIFDDKYAEAKEKTRSIFNYYFACEDNARCLVKFRRVCGEQEGRKSAYLEMLDLLDKVLQARESKIINNYEYIQQVVNVEKIINDLPTGTDLKAKHEEDVKKAREEFEKLSDEQKGLLDPAVEDKLRLCELIIIERKEKLINISSKATVQLEYTSRTYNGKAYTPSVIVKMGDEYLKEGEDFFVQYANNKGAGLATVTVIGDNDYVGAVKATFKILPKKTSIKKIKGAKKALKITWKKQAVQTSGYQIQLSTKKSFKKKATKTVTVSKAKITSKTVKKLKAKKKYYVRIRTFKKVGKTKYYSTWSPVRTEKTKK